MHVGVHRKPVLGSSVSAEEPNHRTSKLHHMLRSLSQVELSVALNAVCLLSPVALLRTITWQLASLPFVSRDAQPVPVVPAYHATKPDAGLPKRPQDTLGTKAPYVGGQTNPRRERVAVARLESKPSNTADLHTYREIWVVSHVVMATTGRRCC